MESGIYQITNSINGKHYIGSSSDISHRKSVHLSTLDKGRHHSRHLQSAWLKYGGRLAFLFDVLERCPPKYLLEREQYWLDRIKPEYNILACARSPRGRIDSEETCRKRSIAMTGRFKSEETKAKISAALIGRKIPRDIVERISRSRMGVKRRPHTIETRNLISKALVGRKLGPRSSETRAKIAKAACGRIHSPGTRQKISINRSGKGIGERPISTCLAIARAKAHLTEEQVRGIRQLRNSGVSYADIGIYFGISKTTAGQISRRQAYLWVLD